MPQSTPLKKRTPKKRTTIKGSGDYTEATKSISDPMRRLEGKIDHLEHSLVSPSLNRLSSSVGRTLGGLVGMSDLGGLAGSSLAKYFGHGDYKIMSNSLMAGSTNMSGAKFQGDGKRGTRLKEREFIGNVFSGVLTGGSTDFINASYPINPTNLSTFPWLSTIAPLYDQWEPHGIVFEFISTSSEYASNQALGSIIMATDYDTYDALYPSKIVMENSDYACSTKPSNGLIHGIECDKLERPTPILYTNTSNASLPLTMSTLGNFQLATTGQSVANLSLGELWVSYDITFYKKQLVQSALLTTPTLVSNGTPSGANFIVANATVTVQRQITFANNRINFNNAAVGIKYLVQYYCTSHNTGNNYLNWNGGFATLVAKAGGGSVVGQPAMASYVCTTTASGAFLDLSTANFVGGTYNLSVSQVPSDYNF